MLSKMKLKECKTRNPWTLAGLERKPNKWGLLQVPHAAPLSWPYGPPSPWLLPLHIPLSVVMCRAIYGGKAWQMQGPSAKSLDAFLSSPLPAEASGCIASSSPGTQWGLWLILASTAELLQVWWVSLSLLSTKKPLLVTNPFILNGIGRRSAFRQACFL